MSLLSLGNSGDDIKFRTEVAADSKYLYLQVVSVTQKPTIIFVDEVQKSEAIFDALKYAFDHAKISFIVSGSNPDFLKTVARKRLQRRGHLIAMSGFSAPEILAHSANINRETLSAEFRHLLLESTSPVVENHNLTLSAEIIATTASAT